MLGASSESWKEGEGNGYNQYTLYTSMKFSKKKNDPCDLNVLGHAKCRMNNVNLSQK